MKKAHALILMFVVGLGLEAQSVENTLKTNLNSIDNNNYALVLDNLRDNLVLKREKLV